MPRPPLPAHWRDRLSALLHEVAERIARQDESHPPPDAAAAVAPAILPEQDGGPPAHWVERVRRSAPGLLERAGLTFAGRARHDHDAPHHRDDAPRWPPDATEPGAVQVPEADASPVTPSPAPGPQPGPAAPDGPHRLRLSFRPQAGEGAEPVSQTRDRESDRIALHHAPEPREAAPVGTIRSSVLESRAPARSPAATGSALPESAAEVAVPDGSANRPAPGPRAPAADPPVEARLRPTTPRWLDGDPIPPPPRATAPPVVAAPLAVGRFAGDDQRSAPWPALPPRRTAGTGGSLTVGPPRPGSQHRTARVVAEQEAC